jgi:hypothetical protein
MIALQREAMEAEEKLRRLYRMVEDGLAEMDDLPKLGGSRENGSQFCTELARHQPTSCLCPS